MNRGDGMSSAAGQGTGGAEVRRERTEVSNEWHARPNISLPPPFRCTHLVSLRVGRTEAECRRRISEFCERSGSSAPSAGSRYHLVEIGPARLKWELHTEATSHTILVPGNGRPPFSESAIDFLDAGKRDDLTADMFVGVQIEVLRPPGPEDEYGAGLAQSLLGAQVIYGGLMSDGKAAVWSSFHLDSRGFVRLVIVDLGINERRLARLLQRLLDMESYRMLAMRSLPAARGVMATLQELEPKLDAVMRSLADSSDDDARERALQEITGIAARVERLATAHASRFAGTRAYGGIVERRAEEVQELAIGNYQRYTQFLTRALLPGMRTCDAAERRIGELAGRVGRSATLLSTMVDIEQARQSNNMLQSMARNARAQLRLQQAVEGFSIFAISYYAVGLLKYTLSAAEKAGLGISATLVTGLAAPLVFALVLVSIRTVRRKLVSRSDRADDSRER